MTVAQAMAHAISLHQAGQIGHAETIYRQVLVASPQHADALQLLGVIALEAGQYAVGIDLISKAVAIVPNEPVYLANLGEAYRRNQQPELAVACLQRTIALDPKQPVAHLNLAGALAELERCEEAIVHCQRSLELVPNQSAAYTNWGGALSSMGRLEEAVETLQRAIALDPTMPQAHGNLGKALSETGDFEGSIAACRKALELNPNFPEAYSTMGTAQARIGQFEEALASYRRAIELRPNFAFAHANVGMLLILLGRFQEGWNEYLWRSRIPLIGTNHPDFVPLHWKGEPLPGGTLLLHAEQGFGDTLNFFRCLPLVLERSQAKKVFLTCQPPLTRLLARHCPPGVELISRKIGDQAPLPPFDRHSPLLTLPPLLDHLEPFTVADPYLTANPTPAAAWKARLEPDTRFRVGLSWKGSSTHKNDRRRSIAAELFLPLLQVPGVAFHSLQLDVDAEKAAPLKAAGLIDHTHEITDFEDSAAYMANLDLIISVDTAAIHLAGALSRPVWTLLSSVPDWRWGLAGETTGWYPSMRLFRQPALNTWPAVIERVAAALRERVEAHAPPT